MDIDEGEDAAYGETLKVMDISLGRAPEPKSSNEEVCISRLLKSTTSAHCDI